MLESKLRGFKDILFSKQTDIEKIDLKIQELVKMRHDIAIDPLFD